MRSMTVRMYRNRIAFENMSQFPEDSDEQQHECAAAMTWEARANAEAAREAMWETAREVSEKKD